MRVLILPLISTKHKVWRESDYIVYWQLAKALPEMWFTMMVNPEVEILAEYALPNLGYLKTDAWHPFTASQAIVPDGFYDLLNPLNGRHQVDAVVTSRVPIGAGIKRLLSYSSRCRVPVVLIEPFAANGNCKTVDELEGLELLLKAMSYAECPTIFGTSSEQAAGLAMSQRYLSSAMLKKLDKTAILQSTGVPLAEIQKRADELDKFDTFTVLFAARFNSNKQWDKVLDAMETFCRMTPDTQGKAICSSMPDDVRLTYFQKVEIQLQLPRQEYVDTLCRSHIAVSDSIQEGLSAGWAEQIATGNPVLLPRRKWAKGLMPHSEYDICFHSGGNELVALMAYVKDNYEKVRAVIRPAVDKFVAVHDLPVAARGCADVITSTVDGTFETFSNWAGRMRKVLTTMSESFTLEEFAKACGKVGMPFGLGFRQLSALNTYRNLYFWLKQNAKLLPTLETRFEK